MTKALLLSQLAAAGFMTGLIWFAQLVHYPLFAYVAPSDFPSYQARNIRLTSFVVMPVMVVETCGAGALLWFSRTTAAGAAFALIVAVWLSTAFVQYRQHDALRGGFDAELHARLLRLNWLRCAAWTMRFALLIGMLA